MSAAKKQKTEPESEKKQPPPSLPVEYTVPEVWKQKEIGGRFGAMNRPTAGARSEEALPKGEHAIQLYSLGTPNGHKVTILLEELGVEYDAWITNIMELKQFTSGFVGVNPNSKIPCMLDYKPDGDAAAPDDSEPSNPLRVFESGSILFYLAEKHGKFMPKGVRARTECMNWLMWQMGCAPYIGGGFGHFYKYAPVRIEYAIDRFSMETKRQLDVLDQALAGKEYLCGEYSIADIAIFPWIRCIDTGYNAAKFLDLSSYKNVAAWMERINERKAVKRGMRVNGFTETAITNRHSKDDFKPEEYDIQ